MSQAPVRALKSGTESPRFRSRLLPLEPLRLGDVVLTQHVPQPARLNSLAGFFLVLAIGAAALTAWPLLGRAPLYRDQFRASFKRRLNLHSHIPFTRADGGDHEQHRMDCR